MLLIFGELAIEYSRSSSSSMLAIAKFMIIVMQFSTRAYLFRWNAPLGQALIMQNSQLKPIFKMENCLTDSWCMRIKISKMKMITTEITIFNQTVAPICLTCDLQFVFLRKVHLGFYWRYLWNKYLGKFMLKFYLLKRNLT